MKSIRIALAQINVTVGALQENAEKIAREMEKAKNQGAQLVAFPELVLSGYPPEDLLLRPSFLQACRKTLENLAPASRGISAIIGFPEFDGNLFNAAAFLCDGKLIRCYRKNYLPNYGVFDEDRYFKPSKENFVFSGNGFRFGVTICEDIWYSTGPHQAQASQGKADLLLNISASPYHQGKFQERKKMLSRRAADTGTPLAYCNLVGGQDELVFDGNSMVFDSAGKILALGKPFEEDLIFADIPFSRKSAGGSHEKQKTFRAKGVSLKTVSFSFSWNAKPAKPLKPQIGKPLEKPEEIYQALILGTRDYIRKNQFSKVVIGLSGGIDSALVACVAVDALGKENVVGVSMPSRYSSSHSKEDARILAGNLGIEYHAIPIEEIYQAFLHTLSPCFANTQPTVAEENLQSRIRGTLLMALSNQWGWLVLTTGNKSEMAVGYSTLYGDMAGGFAVIKDVPKTLVYSLARHRNLRKPVIPKSILTKPPSAELRPDQKDSDSLPEYGELDPILTAYIERNLSPAEIVKAGYRGETVKRVIRLVDRAEYKRRQAPPGVKITPRALGKDWRLPLTSHFS